MTLHTTRWSPDTCGCVIDYEWDDAAPEDTRTHSLAGMAACCAAHSALPPPVVFNTVMEENQRKNRVLAIVIDALGLTRAAAVRQNIAGQLRQVVSETARQILFKQLIDALTPTELADLQRLFSLEQTFRWSFDAQRRLRVTLVGVPLPAPQRVAIQAALDAELGPGWATLL